MRRPHLEGSVLQQAEEPASAVQQTGSHWLAPWHRKQVKAGRLQGCTGVDPSAMGSLSREPAAHCLANKLGEEPTLA
ncbi:hypothetical protein KIL84_010671 [Mauremys mutica]|uniref:Uncharacterized protein n=1 Tax=Mauremys mutica TaxID=74926 RepID=A0A9D4B168_9SAUR|nr:hypothetical protein KIL84_010671 [Mauremys mutica]